jgi:hypothetical protein
LVSGKTVVAFHAIDPAMQENRQSLDCGIGSMVIWRRVEGSSSTPGGCQRQGREGAMMKKQAMLAKRSGFKSPGFESAAIFVTVAIATLGMTFMLIEQEHWNLSGPAIAVLILTLGLGPPTVFAWAFYLSRTADLRKIRTLERHVVRIEHGKVVERNRNGQVVGTIDPGEHFSVAPTTVEHGLGYYVVTQGDQKVEISSRAPQAEQILCKELQVESWPPDYVGALPF